MDRQDVIEYLQRKGKIRENEEIEPKFNKKENEEIDKVMKHGKIYGDPLVELY